MNPRPQQTYNQYKLRTIGKNEFGPIWGITIPREIAMKFSNVKFTIESSNDKIIFTSGLDIIDFKKNIRKYKIEQY